MRKIDLSLFGQATHDDDKGLLCPCAACNRIRVKYGLFTTAYLMAENWLKSSPPSRPLPSWIPRGELPKVSENEASYNQLQREHEEVWAEYLDAKKEMETSGEQFDSNHS